MKRVLVYCEGPTEETFVNRILAPYFYPLEIFLTASSCGGVSRYSRIKRDLTEYCKRDPQAIITTMLDYYGLPSDTPGVNNSSPVDLYQRVYNIERLIKEDIGTGNLRPNIILHEFEALLFSDPKCFAYCDMDRCAIQKLCEIREKAESPEHINNGVNTAPSKRILAVYPAYTKPLDGYNISKKYRLGCDATRVQTL